MQRYYNWFIILFLFFLTIHLADTRDWIEETIYARFKANCTLTERLNELGEEIVSLDEEIISLTEVVTLVPIVHQELQDISVKVVVGQRSGSGVLFNRKIAGEWKTFIWTAGHVAECLQRKDKTFSNAIIKFEWRYCGQLFEKWEEKARVIAYSNKYTGEDLALLELELLKNSYNCYPSVDFAGDEIQKIGTKVIHVGSASGFYNSVSLGIVSQTDRKHQGKTYDQTSTMAYPGSSGGGVYTTDGKCIGLVTRGVGPGQNFYVPVRRIRAWAKREGIEWAMDKKVLVPLSRTPTELEMIPRETEIIISLPPPPVFGSDAL